MTNNKAVRRQLLRWSLQRWSLGTAAAVSMIDIGRGGATMLVATSLQTDIPYPQYASCE